MVNNLARVRARESAEAWLAERKASLPTPPRVSAAWVETALVDAFAAGWGQATAPGTEAEVNEIVVSLVRDAIEAAGDSAPEEAAAIDAAQRIVAYLGAIHREEQDQWGEERQIGQRQLDDARALIEETALLLRGYEAHHLDRAGGYREEAAQAHGHRKDGAVEDQRASLVKAERNALAAARLEAWLAGEDRYPTNPAEALRQIAERMVDGETIRGVDHPSFDAAAAKLDEIVLPEAAPGVPIPMITGHIDRDGKAHRDPPGTIYRLGESVDLVDAMAGAALIEEGVGWVKVHGVRCATDLFNVLRLAKLASEAGEPDAENAEADVAWFAGARWRKEGVADLTAFRLTTGDPRFDPAKPVSVNGFTYHPTKED